MRPSPSPLCNENVNGVMNVVIIAVFVHLKAVIFTYFEAEADDSDACDSQEQNARTIIGVQIFRVVIVNDANSG